MVLNGIPPEKQSAIGNKYYKAAAVDQSLEEGFGHGRNVAIILHRHLAKLLNT